MNIPDEASEAAEQAGEYAYIMGGAPEDVAKAAVHAAAPFLLAQGWDEGTLAPDWSAPNPYRRAAA